MTKFYTAKYDAIFKAIFCKKENEDLLKFLLEKCLNKKIIIKEVKAPEILKENIYEKGKTLDVLVEAEGHLINIEVNSGYYGSLHRRNAAFIFNKYSSETKVGEEYTTMKEHVQINFTCNLPKDYPLVGEYKLRDKTSNKEFIDNLTIYEYNLDKINKKCYNEDENYNFVAMLNSDSKELEKICGGNEYMEKFKEEVEKLNNDEEMVFFLSQEEDNRKLRNTIIAEAKQEGLAKGIKEGKKEEKINIAKNMLKENIDMETIKKVTSLTKQEIENLK